MLLYEGSLGLSAAGSFSISLKAKATEVLEETSNYKTLDVDVVCEGVILIFHL